MEIAKVIAARAVRLFDSEELNPRGKSLSPMIQGIRQRYKFLHGPERLEDVELEKGLKFWDGSFLSQDTDIAIRLEIFKDGIVVTTQSDTSDADDVIEDLLSWATEAHGIGNKNYILNARRAYRSELIVFAPETRLNELCENLNQLASLIPAQSEGPIQLTGFSLGGESPKNSSLFTFERRVNIPFEEHKYYTSSSMHTEEHLQVLRHLADLFPRLKKTNPATPS